jgi:hypothetical protein
VRFSGDYAQNTAISIGTRLMQRLGLLPGNGKNAIMLLVGNAHVFGHFGGTIGIFMGSFNVYSIWRKLGRCVFSVSDKQRKILTSPEVQIECVSQMDECTRTTY